MPSMVVLGNSFEKFLMNIIAWDTMAMDDGGADPMEKSASWGSVLISFETRIQIDLGAMPSNIASTSELKELRNKLEAALK